MLKQIRSGWPFVSRLCAMAHHFNLPPSCLFVLCKPLIVPFVIVAAFFAPAGGILFAVATGTLRGSDNALRAVPASIFAAVIVLALFWIFYAGLKRRINAVLSGDILECEVESLERERPKSALGLTTRYVLNCRSQNSARSDVKLEIPHYKVGDVVFGDRLVFFVMGDHPSPILYRPEYRCLVMQRNSQDLVSRVDGSDAARLYRYAVAPNLI